MPSSAIMIIRRASTAERACKDAGDAGADLSVDGYDVSMLQDDPLIDLAYGADVAAALEGAGVRVMQNEYELLNLDGTELMLVGVDDAWAGRADPPPEVPETDAFTIYMIHEPGAGRTGTRT